MASSQETAEMCGRQLLLFFALSARTTMELQGKVSYHLPGHEVLLKMDGTNYGLCLDWRWLGFCLPSVLLLWSTQNQSHLPAGAGVELSLRTQAGGIQRADFKSGVRLAQAVGKGVLMHCSHGEWPHIHALRQRCFCSSTAADIHWESPQWIPWCSGLLLLPWHLHVSTPASPHTSLSSASRAALTTQSWGLQNLLKHSMWILFWDIRLRVLQFFGSRLGWFPAGFCLFFYLFKMFSNIETVSTIPQFQLFQ